MGFCQCCQDKCPMEKCESTKGDGFSCPAGGVCPDGKCTQQDREFVDLHNMYRCMHDVPAVQWSKPMYDDIEAHFKTVDTMTHTKSYQIKPPAGPAGENLFLTSATVTAKDSVAAWYSEIGNCISFDDGCQHGNGVTGHFTPIVWNGVTQIGCGLNDKGLGYCRYKSYDVLTCRTPNMQGGWKNNVFAPVKGQDECEKLAKSCSATATG